MATKNPFKGMVKALLSKTTNRVALVIERKDGKYYLTNGQMILMVDVLTYDSFLRPLSPMFIPLVDGLRAETDSTKELPNVENGRELIFVGLYNEMVSSEHGYVKQTGFYFNTEAGMSELWNCGNELAMFSVKYAEPLCELATAYNARIKGKGTWQNGIHFEDEQERCGAIILPINYDGAEVRQSIDELCWLTLKKKR